MKRNLEHLLVVMFAALSAVLAFALFCKPSEDAPGPAGGIVRKTGAAKVRELPGVETAAISAQPGIQATDPGKQAIIERRRAARQQRRIARAEADRKRAATEPHDPGLEELLRKYEDLREKQESPELRNLRLQYEERRNFIEALGKSQVEQTGRRQFRSIRKEKEVENEFRK